MANTKKVLNAVSKSLVVVGGLTWGTLGAFDFNAVNKLLSGVPMLENGVYVLVGASTLYQGYYWLKKS